MTLETVTVFAAYPFAVGQKIRIQGSKRQGDWEVINVDDTNVTLRCPVSGREFSWKRFCYYVGDEQRPWPQHG